MAYWARLGINPVGKVAQIVHKTPHRSEDKFAQQSPHIDATPGPTALPTTHPFEKQGLNWLIHRKTLSYMVNSIYMYTKTINKTPPPQKPPYRTKTAQEILTTQ